MAWLVLAGDVRAQDATAFEWPASHVMALSLSFDDARNSQVDVGLDLFNRAGALATFFVVPGAVEQRLEGWRRMRAAGHEIGNHTLTHPCTGNFSWARDKALESYTIASMRHEIEAANERIEALLGVAPEVFAYPCGQTFVGRGAETRSYVPLVAELFLAGRGWLDEAPNDPTFVDPAQVLAIEMDGKTFEDLLPILEQAAEDGLWVVLAGHEIGGEIENGGAQTTHVDMLERLIRYANEPSNHVWLAPVGTVIRYVNDRRSPVR